MALPYSHGEKCTLARPGRKLNARPSARRGCRPASPVIADTPRSPGLTYSSETWATSDAEVPKAGGAKGSGVLLGCRQVGVRRASRSDTDQSPVQSIAGGACPPAVTLQLADVAGRPIQRPIGRYPDPPMAVRLSRGHHCKVLDLQRLETIMHVTRWRDGAYRHIIESSPTVLIGDLNSNAIWDTWHPKELNHTALVTTLSNFGLVSSYHDFFQEPHGSETRPTCYLLWKQDRPYHIDCKRPPTRSANSWAALPEIGRSRQS